jgi:hypothetical protein
LEPFHPFPFLPIPHASSLLSAHSSLPEAFVVPSELYAILAEVFPFDLLCPRRAPSSPTQFLENCTFDSEHLGFLRISKMGILMLHISSMIKVPSRVCNGDGGDDRGDGAELGFG